ncbi:MAG: hypothetical protein WAT71_02140 [Ignavibacteria bacterium]
MILKNKELIIILITNIFLLLIPFIAMQFTNEVNWTLIDFTIASALLISFGLICDLILKKIKNINYRVAI